MVIHQISVFLENRAGTLAEITGILSAQHIDLRAIHIAETADYGVLRLIADDSQRASAALLEHGFILSMTPVAAIAVPDEPGGLNRLLQVLSAQHVDIEYMYSVFGRTNGHAYMIFRVSDPEGLAAIASAAGLHPADGAELGVC